MINDTKPLRYAELVIKPCSRTYGSSPCTAAVGVSGDFKCYNSPRTCQDPANYLAGGEQILRWSVPTSDLPIDIPSTPCITGITRRPLQIDPAEGLGVRESVTVSMHNFRTNDTEFDQYPDSRTFNPYNQGTYWGKFFSRWGSLEGYEFRTVDGVLGQDINDMTRRYYIVDGVAGPDSKGSVSFTVKDVVKFIDSDKSQWPLPNNGTCLSDILAADTSFNLSPFGIGDIEYPASGVASLGDEKVTFTRAGDVVTFTGRGLSGTPQEDHDEGTTLQVAAVFTAQDPAVIIRDLLEQATTIPAEYIDYATWKIEVDDFLGRLYSAEIMQPTAVSTLIQELVKEAGLIFFVDVIAKVLVLRVLRQEVPVLQINDDYILAGQIASRPMRDRRVSDVWVYYGKKNPLEAQTEKKNYRGVYAKASDDPVVALENNPPAIREIMSRWILLENLPAAQSVADRVISRYQKIPREVGFKVPSYYSVKLADVVSIQSHIFEDSQGVMAPAFSAQITSIDDSDGIISAVAEEVNFSEVEPPDPNLRIINVNSDVKNINLRTLHDLIYTPIIEGATVRLIVADGVKIGSVTYDHALELGPWPASVTIEIDGTGRIQGRGGDMATTPIDGGTAMFIDRPVTIVGDVKIWGGGGNGGAIIGSVSYAGGAGAGFSEGQPISSIDATEYGSNGIYSKGGDVGQAGEHPPNNEHGIGYAGGAAGIAIDGVSFVTITGTPDIRGPQVN